MMEVIATFLLFTFIGLLIALLGGMVLDLSSPNRLPPLPGLQGPQGPQGLAGVCRCQCCAKADR